MATDGNDSAPLKGRFVKAQERVDRRVELVEAVTDEFKAIHKKSAEEKDHRDSRALVNLAGEMRKGLDGIQSEVAAGGPGALTDDHLDRLKRKIFDDFSPEEREQFGLPDKPPSRDSDQNWSH